MQPTTYILVTDSSRADLYVSDDALHSMNKTRTFSHAESRRTPRELDSDRPGQAASAGRGFHSLAGDHNPQKHEADVFARELGHFLHTEHSAGRFAQLHIAAPPQFLGQLRQHLSGDCQQVLGKTIDKHLGQLDTEQILAHFR